jgi:hypothetical protein
MPATNFTIFNATATESQDGSVLKQCRDCVSSCLTGVLTEGGVSNSIAGRFLVPLISSLVSRLMT